MPPLSDWLVYWNYVVLAALLLVAAVVDVRTGKIPNWLTYPAVAAGLVGHTLGGGLAGTEAQPLGLAGSLTGLAAGFLPMFAASMLGGIGGGDVKLVSAIGALTGWRFTVSTMLFGLLIAALMAIAIILHKRMFWDTMKRIGRFLYLTVTPAKPGSPTTEKSPKVPNGLAFCLGASVALVEVLLRGGEAPVLFLGI